MVCPFTSPMSSSGILYGSSLMSTEGLDPLFTSLVQYQVGPISYSPLWPMISQKLPSEIQKFNENLGEDLSMHDITYHLWCSSNSLNDDSVRLRLFQHTLTVPTAQ